jgi:hypothetical protein
MTLGRIAGWLAVVLFAGTAHGAAFVFGGGGTPSSDCLMAFSGEPTRPVAAPHDFRCADGEACDADGVVNGACQFPIAACLNSTHDLGRCSLSGVASVVVAHALDNGDPKFDPEFQAFQARISALDLPTAIPDQCSLATDVRVKLKGPYFRNACYRGTKILRVDTSSSPILGRVYRDTDIIRFECDPSPTLGCDPQTLYTGTFDRIQRQIFDQSCALGGCHDSQSKMSGLLLEQGAAYASLVNVSPINAAALSAGWKRVLPGDLASSLLVHKVKGDLPSAAFGVRMPRDRTRLNPVLIRVIQQWVEAGAPETGWVPGTF